MNEQDRRVAAGGVRLEALGVFLVALGLSDEFFQMITGGRFDDMLSERLEEITGFA